MKIAVDARELSEKSTGVGRYLGELLEQWSADPSATRHAWTLYTHEPLRASRFVGKVRTIPGEGGTQWEQWRFPRAIANDRPHVLFAPAYSAPLSATCPVVLVIHDVAFYAHPQWFSFREGMRRRALTAWSARRARTVITDSNFSRDEIVRHLGIPSEKVRVIPLGMRPANTSPANTREPVILYVGSIFTRRHVDRLIDAFAEVVAERVPESRLEIVGENRAYPPLDLQGQLARCPSAISARVRLHSYVDEPTLNALYSRAAVFAFPSEYEGFGLTPLEALSRGVPAIVLDTSIAREVYGPAARYVSPNLSNVRALGDAMIDLLMNESSRTAVLQHADEVLGRYDWNRTATATLRAIEEAAGA